MNQQTSLNNLLYPLESRMSNNAVSSAEASSGNAITHNVHSSSGWTTGESSSRLTLQNQTSDHEVKMEERWSSPEDRRFEPTNILFPGRVNINTSSDHQARSGPFSLPGSSSNNVPSSSVSNAGYGGDSGGLGTLSSGLEIEQASSSSASSDDIGPSGTLAEENNVLPGSSLGGWGLSCKRKALEGTSSSGQSCPGGSSSFFPEAENGSWLSAPIRHNVTGGSSLSSSSRSSGSPSDGPLEQMNGRIGFGVRGVASEAFPSSSVTGNTELLRNFGRRANSGQHRDSLTFNLSTAAGARHSNAWSLYQSPRPVPFSDSLDLRSTAPLSLGAPQGQTHGVQTFASSSNMHPCPWNGSSDPGIGIPSSPLISGEGGAALQEEANLRSIPRNSTEHSMLLPPPDIRNTAQGQTGWTLPGNITTSGHVPCTRIGPGSSANHIPTSSWLTHPNPAMHNHQRFSDFSPWSLFPSVDHEPVGSSSHFPPLSSGPSASSQETMMSSGSSSQGHNQAFSRSAFSVEGQGDDALGMPRSLRALAADIEGRHRLISEIRQVLNAMRRGENLRVEDYMLFDPFIYHGMAEMHDRHRDMRLDVDNMSYEELLALEERIGDVSTGLSEATILKSMKQQKHASVRLESQDVEPCCICQEEYVEGDDVGLLDCGHDFHSGCIKQWLMMKNLCPICKMTALPT